MPISRKRLLKRREELALQLEQLRQQFAAVQGALADVDFWLHEDEAAHKPAPKKE